MAAPGDELRNPVTGQTITFLDRGPDALVVETTYRAGGPPAVVHLHPRQEERFEVLSGAVRVSVNGERRTLRQGELLVIPPGTPHSFGGDPDEDARVRWETRPALRTAEFFENTFGLAADGRVSPRTGVPGILQFAVMAQEYADEFRLAKPARPIQVALFSLLAPVGRMRGLRASYPEYARG